MKGKKVTIYIRDENTEFAQDLLDQKEMSKWVNQQIDKAIMYSSKGLQKKLEKLEQDQEYLKNEKEQIGIALDRAKEFEEKRRKRLRSQYSQQPINPF